MLRSNDFSGAGGHGHRLKSGLIRAPSKALTGAGFRATVPGRTYRGNAGIVTHKVQMLAPAGSVRSRFRLLTPFATNTYALPFIWFHGCTVPSGSPERIGRVGGQL